LNDLEYKIIIYTFGHLKRRFLYSKKYIKIIYYNTLMNNEELIKENLLLKEEIELLKEKLKNYTAPKRSKKFYEIHKEEIKQKVR
jgi:hypothetical protein